MTLPAKEMHSYLARLETFQQLHHLSKRRASSQSKKKNANTVQWPHEQPDPNYVRLYTTIKRYYVLIPCSLPKQDSSTDQRLTRSTMYNVSSAQ